MEKGPVGFSSIVHFDIHSFKTSEWAVEVGVIIAMAVNVLGFPCNGGML
jgi:hypothetical protein